MRRIFKAAAVALFCVAMVTAGATASLAAPQANGIEWNTYGTTVSPRDTVRICPSGSGFQPGQTILVQVLRNGSWTDVRTFGSPTLPYQWCVEIAPWQLASQPGQYTFRALTRATAAAPLSEAQVTLDLRGGEQGSAYLESVPEMTTTTARAAVSVEVGLAYGQRVDLQRKSGSQWSNVASAQAPHTGTRATVTVTIPAKVGLSTYRVVDRASAWTTTYAGEPFRVHQTDAAKHRAYIVKARKLIAAYCPKTPIYIDTPSVAGRGYSGLVGQASARWWGDVRSGRLTTAIELRSGMPTAQLRHVALHECAHILQYRTYVEGRYEAELGAANRRFPGTGNEGQADCMAYHFTKQTRHLYYVRGCTKAQLADAQRMWRAYGKKYQAADYRW